MLHSSSAGIDSIIKIHSLMKPGEPSNLENAQAEINRLFFNPRTYNLGMVGRYKISKKFGLDIESEKSSILTKEDIIGAIKYLLYLIAEVDDHFDDDYV